MSALSDHRPNEDSPKPGKALSISDAQLIRDCLQGNKNSYRLLYRRYQGQVRSILYPLSGGSGLDDLVQEVFLRVWKGLPKFRQSCQFSTWLYRITWNVAADRRRELVRSHSQQQVLEIELRRSPEDPDWMQLHYQDLVQRGLQVLSLDHRAVLVLHDLEDISQKEIAQILEIPIGTVKSRLFHARNALRQFLQQEGVQL